MYFVTGFKKIRIPENILDVLFKEGTTLIIKGDAGTGKTKMALEIMSIARSKGIEAIYLTVGVPSKQLKKENPWIDEEGLGDRIFDLTTKGALIEADTVKLGLVNVPDFLKAIISKINEFSKEYKTTLLIIDSIDEIKALVGLPEEDFSLERYFINFIKNEEKKTSLIMIKESIKNTQLDFLGDIILELYYNEFNRKILREIKIKKIRSKKLSHPKLLYTLNGGRFTTIEPFPFKVEAYAKFISYTPIPKSKRKLVKTGIPSIDRMAGGGLRPGDLLVIETDAISSTLMNTLAYTLVRNFVKNKIPVFVVPRLGGIVEDILNAFRYCLRERDFEYLTYFTRQNIESSNKNIVKLGTNSLSRDIDIIIRTMEEKKKQLEYKGPVVNIISADAALSVYQFEDIKKALLDNKIFELIKNNITIVELPELPAYQSIFFLKNATYYIKAVSVGEYVVMYGIKPHTQLVVPCIEFIEEKRKRLIVDGVIIN
ncbi:MAG: ATPase domain-containing protein [Candidatus Asgardarchaeia archaeon]